MLVLVVGALALRAPALEGPLLERHGFRQTQTAYQAVEFRDHGIDLLHPHLPVLGPPYEVPYELPVFQAVATVPMHLGVDADLSLRVTALLCFGLTALLLFGLLRHVTNRIVAFAALAAFLLSPFGMVWSRASLMEYTATAAALGFVWAGIVWRDTRALRFAVIATLALSVALTVKMTSVFWVAPFVLYRSKDEVGGVPAWLRERLSLRVVAPVAIAVGAGIAWTRHADSVKAASPATRWLTSSALAEWNFGTPAQRLDLSSWATVFDRARTLLLGGWVWALLVALALLTMRKRRRELGFWIGMVLAAVLPVVVFFNLYVVHDYYLASVSPALAALVGLAAHRVWQHAARVASPRLIAVGLAFLWIVPAYLVSRPYWETAFEAAPALDSSRVIAATTARDDPVVVEGDDWDPSILYYARRRGLMLDPRIASPAVVALLHRSGFHDWYTLDPADRTNDVLRTWRWVASTGPRSYRMAGSRTGLGDAQLVATSDRATVRSLDTRATASDAATVTVPCDGRAERTFPAGADGTWLVLDHADRDGLRLLVDRRHASLPGAPALFVGPRLARAGVTLHCTGGGTVRVRAVGAPT